MLKKLKVNITKIGKNVIWKAMQISTPCKFFIDAKDKMRFKITMKQHGIKESEYTISELKDQTKGIQEANKKVEKQVVEAANKISEEVNKSVKDAPKEDKKVEADLKGSMKFHSDKKSGPKEQPKPEPKEDSKDNKNNKK